MIAEGPTSTSPGLVGFKRHLRAQVVAGEATYLFSERDVTALELPELEALAPLLDGTRDLHDIVQVAADRLSSRRVGALVDSLADAGLVSVLPAEPAADDTELSYWHAAALDAHRASTAIATGRVALTVLDEQVLGPLGLPGLLGAGGLGLAGQDQPADLTVVVCSDYLTPELAAVDRRLRAAARPWLLARPIGTQVWVGPVFRPDGACWHCLEHRLWGHRRAEAHVQATLGRRGPAQRATAATAASTATAMGLVAVECAKWLAGYRNAAQDSVRVLDTLDLGIRSHELRRRPQCPHCGDPALVAAVAERPVVLTSRPKASTAGGGHRASTAPETLRAYEHLISPVTGVVSEVRRDERGPDFFNAFVAGVNPTAGGGLERLRVALRSLCGGKGVTAEQARVSALCEALERFSATSQGDERRVRGSYAALAPAAVHPDDCQLIDRRQYADRQRWNREHAPFQHICDPFDIHREMDWTPVWSLTGQRHRWLPTGMLYYGAQGPGVRPDSNGNAAGSSLEDAVLQGLLELIERDAVALWWYNRTAQPGIDLASCADPWIEELREVHAGLGREVWALDLTADLAIPVAVALSRRVDGGPEEIMLGFGAHLDATVALRRALTELNQMMPAVLDPDRLRSGDPDTGWWLRHATLAGQGYLGAAAHLPTTRLADFPALAAPDLQADVELVTGRLEGRGLEVLVLDQTRPDIGLPVVKVVVPGLRGFWARFAPGRLFDVPVEIGRRSTPLPYAELNPIPMFL